MIQQVPVIPVTRFFEYGLMLHYCISGVKISISDLQYARTEQHRQQPKPTAQKDTHGTWAMEQRLLKLIEEGNLNYRELSECMIGDGRIGDLGNGDSIRQFKNLTIIYTALCTRAAIRGGLDSEIAYSLSDQYIHSIEACSDISDIADINAAMQEDFVRRVHNVKLKESVSPQIRKCCDYIQLHLDRTVTLGELALFSGYSEDYLSRKFRREMELTLGEYIMEQRIQRTKTLLRSTQLSVQEIAEQLGLQSQSYLGQQFKKATGMTPGAYRAAVHE